MKTDLHVHSKDCSDGNFTTPEILEEAFRRGIRILSITDHDSIDCQESAQDLAGQYEIRYIAGLELNISFSYPPYRDGKPISLDVLGYQYDIHNRALIEKLEEIRNYRRIRAKQILEKINQELEKERQDPFTLKDLEAIEETVDGAFGRPHIAQYMVKKGLVRSVQKAFDRYLVKCNVPKMPVSLEEASELIKGAGGKLTIAHPADPNGTSLVSMTSSVEKQCRIIKEAMLPHLDGIECWHSRHDPKTVSAYLAFAREEELIVTGGSDCHQRPVVMGSIDIPPWVAMQFDN